LTAQQSPASDFLKPQKYLKKGGTLGLIGLLGTIGAFSTDMYLPAAPGMAVYFNVPPSTINMVLLVFFVFYAFGLLFWGPLSDKFGRKNILMLSIGIYTLASLACSLAPNIYILIFVRVFQALGAGGMSATSTALVKDCFDGRIRQKVLAIVQVIMVIGPMAAPVIGGQILRFFTWRATFGALVIFGILCFSLTLLLQDPLAKEDRSKASAFRSFGTLAVIVRNKSFVLFLAVAACFAFSYMAYIALGSYIYIDIFGLNEQQYSFYFAVNSLFLAIGPVLYIRLIAKIKPWSFAFLFISLGILAGILILLIGQISPLCFMIAFLPLTLVNSGLRPFNTNILLNQYDGDTGSVAGVINFFHMAAGSVGTLVATSIQLNYVTVIGLLSLICSLVSIGLAAYLKFAKVTIKSLQ